MNKLFTVLGGKFKSSAQDSDLEYLCWRCKNSPVSSDLKPPLVCSATDVPLTWFSRVPLVPTIGNLPLDFPHSVKKKHVLAVAVTC